jgi:hypothetical protein
MKTTSHSSCKFAVLALLSVFFLSISTPAFAQWKWRDKNDRVQYSDLPPPSGVPDSAILQRPQGASRNITRNSNTGTPQANAANGANGANGAERSITLEAMPASGAASAPSKTVDPELDARRKKAEQEDVAKRKEQEEKIKAARAENCTRAKSQLSSLEGGMRIARTNEKGEREFLDDKARAEETKRSRDIMSSDCKI